jgi:hypothetical protein
MQKEIWTNFLKKKLLIPRINKEIMTISGKTLLILISWIIDKYGGKWPIDVGFQKGYLRTMFGVKIVYVKHKSATII